MFAPDISSFPVIHEGDIIRCSNVSLWPSQYNPKQNDFKASHADKQIVVFPLDEKKEPFCVAESFRFTWEDHQQVTKLRKWYSELYPHVIQNADVQRDFSAPIEVSGQCLCL